MRFRKSCVRRRACARCGIWRSRRTRADSELQVERRAEKPHERRDPPAFICVAIDEVGRRDVLRCEFAQREEVLAFQIVGERMITLEARGDALQLLAADLEAG